MKIEVGEEITLEEYVKLPVGEGINLSTSNKGKSRYFKKAQKFPNVFEDGKYAIEVNKEVMTITDKHRKWVFAFVKGMSAKTLIKAVHKFEEINGNSDGN